MDKRCLIQVFGGNGIQFIERNGSYTDDINDAMIFISELSAYEYIDDHGLEHITKVRCIKEKL